jgi:excisionase family DNA binding protein
MRKTADKDDEQDVFGVRELSEYLNIDQRTLYGAVQRKEIPCLRIGDRILISKSVIDRMLGKCEGTDHR